MTHPSLFASAWDTSCAGLPAEMSSLELSLLGDHLAQCGAQRGPVDTLVAVASALQAGVAQHVITVAVLASLLAAAVSLVR